MACFSLCFLSMSFLKNPQHGPMKPPRRKGYAITPCKRTRRGNIQMRVAEDDSRRAYVHTLVKQGEQWQTVGSLYPLAAATFLRASGERVEDSLHVETGKLTGDFAETEGRIGGQIVRGWYTFDPTAPRLKLHFELEATEDIQLLSFQAPSFLAGDRAYGTKKDFAIFSGLEYLETEEPSSSDRDLAYPLNERAVPAIHKIAAPIISVQGADTLAALLWDPHQEWSTGNSYPAAYFNAPRARNRPCRHCHVPLCPVGRHVCARKHAGSTAPVSFEKGGEHLTGSMVGARQRHPLWNRLYCAWSPQGRPCLASLSALFRCVWDCHGLHYSHVAGKRNRRCACVDILRRSGMKTLQAGRTATAGNRISW